jgi:periplasmic divalent cation tolerance protein
MDVKLPRILITTLPDEESASALIRTLLGEQLIACGTLLPGARSLYLWKGEIEEALEILVLMKTHPTVEERCVRRLSELHPYEVPEIMTFDPSAVSRSYSEWVTESLCRAG